MTYWTHRSILSCGLLLFATTAFAQLLPTPDSAPVLLYGDGLRDGVLVGRGVVLDGTAGKSLGVHNDATFSICGTAAEIVWRETRRDTDPEGGTHISYRQHVIGKGFDMELVGSDIAVHRMPDGKLLGISGQQFDSVSVSGCPTFTAARAVESARDLVLLTKGEDAQHREPSKIAAAVRATRLAQTKLKLVQIDGMFRPAYFTVADDASGEPYSVVLDAVDGRLLAIRESNPGSNCAPDGPLNLVTAVGIPVRPEINNWRTVKANVASRPNGYTHEGVTVSSDGLIRQLVYQETDTVTGTDGYRCASDKNYTLVPLKIDPALNPSSPVYKDVLPPNTGGIFYGSSAGDALWHTNRTMETFQSMGRKGWDNQNSDAKIVVRVTGITDGGKFIIEPWLTPIAPLHSVALGPASFMYSSAASLDLVAHEWGHGVILTSSSNFDLATSVGQELHEGFADVIGMLVEKRVQVAGTGIEQSSDWVMHEDMATSGYARGGIDDVDGHPWVGPSGSITYNDRLHREDGPSASGPHATGNILSVAYLLMAEGGSTSLPSGLNPICTRLPSLAGCESSNAMTASEYLGSSKAGSILFHAIQFTLLPSTQWSQVADRVNEAAFQKFNLCQYGPQHNAPQEQNAVRKAFAGIGYPRTMPDIQCPSTALVPLTATGFSTYVTLDWGSATGDVGVTGYAIERTSAAQGQPWMLVASAPPTAASYNDTSVSPGTMYVYRIRAYDAAGLRTYSANDAAVTVDFSDGAINPGQDLIKGAYIVELRNAINAWRAFAGMGNAFTWAPNPTEQVIRAAYFWPVAPVDPSVKPLVEALNEARATLSACGQGCITPPNLGPFEYSWSEGQPDPPRVGGPIKAKYVEELRSAVR